MSKIRTALVALSLLFITTAPLYAVTYIVPDDRTFVLAADAVIVGETLESHSEIASFDRVVTVAYVRAETVLRGDIEAGVMIRLVEPGGATNQAIWNIPGSPRYQPGSRYLIFLRRNDLGEWSTLGMGLGKFSILRDVANNEYVVRGENGEVVGYSAHDWSPHVEKLRDLAKFRTFIETVSGDAGAPVRDDYFAQNVALPSFSERKFQLEVHAGRADYLIGFLRHASPVVNVQYCCMSMGLQPGLDAVGGLGVGTSRWSTQGTSVNYTAGANNESATGGLAGISGRTMRDNISAVLFGDPFNDLPNPPPGQFLLGVGGSYSHNPVIPYQVPGDSTTYFDVAEIDVIMGDNIAAIGQNRFNAAVTHELGHTLGFRHSDKNRTDDAPCSAPLPCSNMAIMKSFIDQDFAGLQQWDVDAIQTVYGSGPVCTPPQISSAFANPFSINAGQSATLTVSASGTTPLTFQWYIGNPPDTSQPIPGATSASVQVTPNTTTNYWVQVTGQCAPPANSQAVQVQVASACPTVSVSATSQPSSNGFTLSANATGGSGFTFQWFIGSSSGPLAGSGPMISVNPQSTTTYVVRATNSCGNVGEASVTVTISGCPTVVPAMPTVTALGGGDFRLSAGASGGSNIQFSWFQGTPPSGNFIESNQTIIVRPTSSTSYFFVAMNSCGNTATSTAIVVTPTLNCVAPQVTAVTANPTSIMSGQSSTLSTTATGTSLAFQWYIGNPGDTSQPIAGANNATVQVSPTATTTYYVQVASGCGAGAINSPPVTVTVTTGNQCVPAAITSQPASASVPLGLSTMLSVAASGTGPISYQWFIGQPGDTSQPVSGATSSSLVVRALAQTTYWVRVTGQCGDPVNSSGATVSVSVSRRRPSRR